MIKSDRKRIRSKKILQEAEGCLDLLLGLGDRFSLPAEIRDPVARRALNILDRITQPGAERSRWLFLRGQALRVMERYELAVAPLSAAAELDSENINIFLALGWCFKRMGQLDRAIESLERAREADADEAIVHYNLACYHSLAGHKKSALSFLSRALEMDAHYRELIDRESDFDAIRDDPEFQMLTSVIV